MSRPDDFGNLEEFEYVELGQIADRFARALEGSPATTRIEDFVPAGSESFRLAVICELIKIDLEHGWKRGRQVYLESYLSRFPDLHGKTDISRLVFEEFRVRHKNGNNPDLQDYARRFPTCYDACKRLAEKEGVSSIGPAHEATFIESASPTGGIRHFEPGAMLFQRYVLLEYIDKGTFGQVWKAQDRDGELVAIKIPKDPLNSKQTLNEMAALTQIQALQHESLLETRNFWVEKNYLFIAMELADGGTLKDRLRWYKEQGVTGIPVEELLPYFQGTSQALDYLHSENKVHRDVKPANILLVKGRAKIADFGLVRELDLQASQSHTVVGSFAYMAPEMMTGRASARSDQYCFAVTYVELRQGRLPFQGRTVEDMLKRDDLDLRSLEEREQQVVARALRKERSERFASCQEFISELVQAIGAGASVLPVASPVPNNKVRAAELTSKQASSTHADQHSPRNPPAASPASPDEVPFTSTIRRQPGPRTRPEILQPSAPRPENNASTGKQTEKRIARSTQSEAAVPPPAQPVLQRDQKWNKEKPGPASSGLWKLVACVLAGALALGGWYGFGLMEKQKCEDDLHELIHAGNYAAAASRLKECPVSQELQEKIENEWWAELETRDNDPPERLADLQKKLADFQTHFPNRSGLDDRRTFLAGRIERHNREREVAELVERRDYQAALARLQDGAVSQEWRDKMMSALQGSWRKDLQDARKASSQVDLEKRRDELVQFGKLFPEDGSVDLLRQQNDAAVRDLFADLVKKNDFKQALGVYSKFKLPKSSLTTLEKQWWPRLDPGDDYEADRLISLQKALAEFQGHFPDKVGLADRRSEIDRRINEAGRDDGLLQTAAKQVGAGKFLAALSILKSVKKKQPEAGELRKNAESGFGEQLQKLSRSKANDELGNQLAEFEKLKIVLADRELDDRLIKYRLEVAWAPFVAGTIDLNTTGELLAKIGKPKNLADNRSFTALTSLVAAYKQTDEPTLDKLIGLVRIKSDDAPPGYHDNLLTALARLEMEKKALSFAQLMALEKAVPIEYKAALRNILVETPRRLLTNGWAPADWKECREFCVAVRHPTNAWMRALQTECDVMLENTDEISKSDLKFDAGWYGVYVKALVLEKQGQFSQAGDLLSGQKNLSAVLKPGIRIDRAERLLESATVRLPREMPHLCRFKNGEDAQKGYDWLTLALALSNLKEEKRPFTNQASIDLLLASAQKPVADQARVRDLAESLRITEGVDRLGIKAYPILLCYVEALRALKNDRDRLPVYALFLEIEKKDLLIDDATLCKEVLEPAIEWGRAAARDPKARLLLAKLLVGLGRHHGKTLAECDAAELKNLDGLAREAITNAGNYWAGHALEGAVLSAESRRIRGDFALMSGGEDRIHSFEKAIAASDRALVLVKNEPQVKREEKAVIHLQRSIEELELGKCLLACQLEKTYYKHFRLALVHADSAMALLGADKATKLSSRQQSAWHARGNALELLAQFAGEKENFEPACAAFVRLIGPKSIYPLIALGRCQLRWAKDVAQGEKGKSKQLLRKAEKNLAAALERAQSPSYREEALILLGKVQFELEEDDAVVFKNLDEAIALGKKAKVHFFAELDAADVAFHRHLRSKDVQSKEVWLKKSQDYLAMAHYRDESYLAQYRRTNAIFHFNLELKKHIGKDDLVARVFGKYLTPRKMPGGWSSFDAPLLLEQLTWYVDRREYEKYLRQDVISDAAQAVALAEKMEKKAAKYPRERIYWLGLRREGLALTAHAQLLLSFDTLKRPSDKKIQHLREAKEHAEQLIRDSDEPWRQSYAKGLKYAAMYGLETQIPARSKLKKDAINSLKSSLDEMPRNTNEEKRIRDLKSLLESHGKPPPKGKVVRLLPEVFHVDPSRHVSRVVAMSASFARFTHIGAAPGSPAKANVET